MEKIHLDGYPFYFYKIKEHTKVKHRVFADYFDKYVKIVGCYSDVNYIDCFSGCGAYVDKNNDVYFGSPILAAIVAKENYEKRGRKVRIFVIDIDEDHLKNIEEIIQFKGIDVSIELINDDYKSGVEKVLKVYPHTPTFYLVDPYGYSLDYVFFEKVRNTRQSEVLINFMYNGLNRGISVDKVKKTINNLYGTNEWEKIRNFKGKEREIAAVNLFKKQLQNIFKYVQEYKISFPDKNRTYYYLIHCCNHHKGLSIMSSSFAKYNNGSFEYRGPLQNQLSFMDTMEYKLYEISQFLFSKYKGMQASFLEIIIESIKNGYAEMFVRKTLYQLENDGRIQIIRIPPYTAHGRQRRGIEENDVVIFRE